MTVRPNNNRPRVAILQCVCQGYRVSLFSALCKRTDYEIKLFFGENLPNSKVKNANDLKDINFSRLRTRFIKLRKRVLPLHLNLISELKKFSPHIILCEGESHFLGYMQAWLYKILYHREAKLIHWSLVALPGKGRKTSLLRETIKFITRNFFQAFVVYSSFGRQCLMKYRVPPEKIFVAVNVGDTQHFLSSGSPSKNKSQLRLQLGMPDKFTILYVGRFDQNKRPELMVELAMRTDPKCYHFCLLGTGPMEAELKNNIDRNNVRNISMLRFTTNSTSLYFRAADVVIVPSRGGVVISEAMAVGIPVIVHHADGVEYDLIQHNETGIHLKEGMIEAFLAAVTTLKDRPELCSALGCNAQLAIKKYFNTMTMMSSIKNALDYVCLNS